MEKHVTHVKPKKHYELTLAHQIVFRIASKGGRRKARDLVWPFLKRRQSTAKNPKQGNRFSDRDFSPGPYGNEAGALGNRQRSSVATNNGMKMKMRNKTASRPCCPLKYCKIFQNSASFLYWATPFRFTKVKDGNYCRGLLYRHWNQARHTFATTKPF